MPVVFAGAPGRVIRLDDPAIDQGMLPGMLAIDKTGQNALSFKSQKSIVTRVTVSQETSQQFLHTLGGTIYLYVFGDRIGMAAVSGICLGTDCDQPGDNEHGVEKMFNWYDTNRLANRSDPLSIAIGNRIFQAYLAQMATAVVDASLNLWQFDLSLFVVPPKIAGAAGQGAAAVNNAGTGTTTVVNNNPGGTTVTNNDGSMLRDGQSTYDSQAAFDQGTSALRTPQ